MAAIQHRDRQKVQHKKTHTQRSHEIKQINNAHLSRLLSHKKNPNRTGHGLFKRQGARNHQPQGIKKVKLKNFKRFASLTVDFESNIKDTHI